MDARVEHDRGLLRFLTCGSVDDGKSTLIGRLLFDTGHVFTDQISALERDSQRYGTTGNDLDLALLVDGLEAEREQGITIDISHRYFSTPLRAFIIADTPGHEQYTRNMATAASQADAAILLVDARKGILTQTRRHATLCALMGIKHIVLAINKIDLVDYSESVFKRLRADFNRFANSIGLAQAIAVPISARYGDNVVDPSVAMDWYRGPTLLEVLETIEIVEEDSTKPFRFSVQYVIRPHLDFRGFAGTVLSGTIRRGETIVTSPSGEPVQVRALHGVDGPIAAARAGDAVVIELEGEHDLSRGQILSASKDRPEIADQFSAHLVWMSAQTLLPGRSYLLRIGDSWIPASVTRIKHKIDVNTQAHVAATEIGLNDIAEVNIATQGPVAFDAYHDNRMTGGFILVDRVTHETAAAGMIRHGLRRATNVHLHHHSIDREARALMKGQSPRCIWLTGLSGSGKSTIADALEARLVSLGKHTMLLDGDNMRHGLNRDLGFTDMDRVENIRRVGEVARLMTDAGLMVIASFISPFRAERALVRSLLPEGEYFEIFVDVPLEECIKRDPKGLYAKALRGDIPNFTGINSPYEVPDNPDLIIDGLTVSVEEAVIAILARLGVT
jgi:bifunctional enzyme CysN/CysC